MSWKHKYLAIFYGTGQLISYVSYVNNLSLLSFNQHLDHKCLTKALIQESIFNRLVCSKTELSQGANEKQELLSKAWIDGKTQVWKTIRSTIWAEKRKLNMPGIWMGRNQLNLGKMEWFWIFDSQVAVTCHLWLWMGWHSPRQSQCPIWGSS